MNHENTTPIATPVIQPNDAPAMVRKIGKTTYQVRVHFSTTSRETMSDKIKRMLKTKFQKCEPQAPHLWYNGLHAHQSIKEEAMLYEEKEKAEIEQVFSVFQDYIRTSPYLEWVWSDKVGYILIVISTEKRYVEEGIVILNAEMLCDRLLSEIFTDVMTLIQSGHAYYEVDPQERAEIERHWKPYIDQLPEYARLCDKQFEK